MPTDLDAEGLKNWLYSEMHFPVSLEQCQKWIDASRLAQRPPGAVSPRWANIAELRDVPARLNTEGLTTTLWLYSEP